MTSAQLVAVIQKADPSGQMKVVLQEKHSIVGPLHEPDVITCSKSVLNLAMPSSELNAGDIGKQIMFI